jgi:hypothetical protein
MSIATIIFSVEAYNFCVKHVFVKLRNQDKMKDTRSWNDDQGRKRLCTGLPQVCILQQAAIRKATGATQLELEYVCPPT